MGVAALLVLVVRVGGWLLLLSLRGLSFKVPLQIQEVLKLCILLCLLWLIVLLLLLLLQVGLLLLCLMSHQVAFDCLRLLH